MAEGNVQGTQDLLQGYTDEKGTYTIHFMSIDNIQQIPRDHTIMYARIVVDSCPQNKNHNHVYITVSGNLINYPCEQTTQTADWSTSKILWNSTLSTTNMWYMCADIKNFHLNTPLDWPQYMKIQASLIPVDFMQLYNLHNKA